MRPCFLFLFLLTATACSGAKEIDSVEIIIPGSYQATKIQGEVQGNWLKSFDDKKLEALVKLALKNNKDLKAAYYQLRAAESEAKLAGAELWPKLSLSVQESRELFNSVPTRGSESVNQAIFSNFKGRRRSTGVSLNVSWELDLWGRLRASYSAAEQSYYASRNDFYATRLSLVAQITKAYYALLEALEQNQIAAEIVDLQRNKVKFIKQRYDSGVETTASYLSAEAELSSLEANLQREKRLKDRAHRQLEILLGEYPGINDLQKANFPKMVTSIPAGLPSELLERRPDLLASRYRLRAAGFNVKKSKAELLPRFSLTASGGGRSHDFKYISNPSSRIWSLVGNLTQPLFEGGRLKEQLTLSEKKQKQALADYESTVLKAFGEVEMSLAADEYLKIIEDKQHKDMQYIEAIKSGAENKYRSGVQSYNIFLDSQKNYLNKKSLWIRSKRERIDNRVDLYLALGGGWSDS